MHIVQVIVIKRVGVICIHIAWALNACANLFHMVSTLPYHAVYTSLLLSWRIRRIFLNRQNQDPKNLRLTAPSMDLTAPSMDLKAPSMDLTAPSMDLTAPSSSPINVPARIVYNTELL